MGWAGERLARGECRREGMAQPMPRATAAAGGAASAALALQHHTQQRRRTLVEPIAFPETEKPPRLLLMAKPSVPFAA